MISSTNIEDISGHYVNVLYRKYEDSKILRLQFQSINAKYYDLMIVSVLCVQCLSYVLV